MAFLFLLLFTISGFFVTGYHPGAEDDGVYLTAVKADLNPALFPHDGDFFQLQLRTSIFPKLMATVVRLSHLPLAWVELLAQLASMFAILWACWNIISQLWEDSRARWGGIAMVSAMFTLPVAGTALYIVDQHLHPRAIATALILAAVSRILARKFWQAVPLIAVSFLMHPLMGALGTSFCCILAAVGYLELRPATVERTQDIAEPATVAAFVPFGWMFGPPSQIWLDAIRSRHWFSLYEWTWYEWLGAIAPILIFAVIARIARKRGELTLARFAKAIFIYSIFQQAFAMIILGPEALIGLTALEPMRYLHLVYIFLALVGGGYLGQYLLQDKVWRWAVFLLLANGGMFIAQRQLYADSSHLELPGSQSSNPWLQAFAWIKENTPEDSYFALDPNYMADPGEDYHSFRALAERSALSDANKDTSVITKVPELGPLWREQQIAQDGWTHFQLADFERLKGQFGVNWVLVSYPAPNGLSCPWHNAALAVCRIP